MASSSTSTSHGNVYDVFLNHRGPDVKRTLASQIYHRLTEHGVRVFFDIEEMQVGEELTTQIKDAIRTASVHLAIFSPGYADSHWCLNELLDMLETEKTIIPIFYDVSPSDLRWTQAREGVYARILSILQCIIQCTCGGDRGGYAGALRMLEKKTTLDKKTPRYDSKIIENWRKALSAAADKSGFEHTSNSDDEGLLVNKVIQRVLEKLPKTPLHVAKYPTGLDGKVEELEMIVSSRQQSGNLATAVGIVGLGGVGKTTLAKQFFNNHRSNYDRSCFLSDVRENAAKNTLNSLQAQLLTDLTAQNEHVNNAAEGIELLKKYLRPSTRALIVVDDVDHYDQLEPIFFPVKNTIHSSSLILVTSRNKDVLKSAEIEESSIYMLKGLNKHHSEELFCWHAFKQPNPVKGFEQLVQKFLDACHGLPLSLKVIGALLFRERDIKYWKEQLDKISNILPEEIQSSLKISFDKLDEQEKNIFLDIACFFIGTDRDTAIRIWNGSRWHGWLGLHKLEKRCLVEIDDKNCIAMHDHLRDLGRDLAKDSKYPRRLWHLNDNLHNLSNNSSVRGIHISLENLAGSCNINSLQLLRAEGDFVDRLFSVGHLRQLIYLHWDNFPYYSLPPSIPIINLRVLYIKGKTLETLWEHESEAPLQLREMVIHANLQMIPESIGKLKHLEKLVLNGFETWPESVTNLTNLQHSVGDMMNLQMLNWLWRSGLQMLPDSVGNMTNLQMLNLRGCCGLQMLPESVGNMTNLQMLNLHGCCSLQMLPESVGNMTNLQMLNLHWCFNLQMLPESVGNMKNLQSLDLGGCRGLQMLPESVGNMTNLQSLDLGGCCGLQMFPESVGNMTNLQMLNLHWCSGLQMLPESVGNMTNLQMLNLHECSSLQMLPESVGNMTNLQSLDLGGCRGLQMLPESVGNMTNLQSLDLDGCRCLQMFPESVGNMTNLQRFDLRGCCGLQMLPESVGNMTNLQSLALDGCSSLQMLPDSVGNMTNLQRLDLRGCSGLHTLPDSVGNMTNLQRLNLGRCSGLQTLTDSVGNMTNLQTLDLGGCSGMQTLPDSVGNVTNLRSLDLFACSGLQTLPDSVGNMTNLQNLSLFGCSGLQTLPDSVGNMTNLRILSLGMCSGLQMLPDSVRNMTNLRELDMHGCSALQMVPNVED